MIHAFAINRQSNNSILELCFACQMASLCHLFNRCIPINFMILKPFPTHKRFRLNSVNSRFAIFDIPSSFSIAFSVSSPISISWQFFRLFSAKMPFNRLLLCKYSISGTLYWDFLEINFIVIRKNSPWC